MRPAVNKSIDEMNRSLDELESWKFKDGEGERETHFELLDSEYRRQRCGSGVVHNRIVIYGKI